MDRPDSNHAVVVVLGDLCRSPRMQYHAEALAAEGWTVDLVGYAEDVLPIELSADPRIRCITLTDPWMARRGDLPRLAFLAIAAGRLVHQSVQLLVRLTFTTPAPALLLVQTPPALPTLAVAWIAARLRRARLVIDWHNFGHAMLALRLGNGNALVRATKSIEGSIGRRADAHLCVSRAMRTELASQWGIEATVLPDRPAARFRRLEPNERRAFFDAHPDLMSGYDPLALDRDAVLVSSTSWTADEDFPMLLDAAALYDARRAADPAGLPPLRLLITGRGPLRVHFEKDFAARRLQHVRLHTAWLEAADYPLALGCADLGVSMHRSASGVDLPMKVADMVGSGLPVCMLDYGPCVHEMIGPEDEGMLFRSASALSARWAELLHGFPSPTAPLFGRARRTTIGGEETWQQGWRRDAAPLLSRGPR